MTPQEADGGDLPRAEQVEATLAGIWERSEFVRAEPNLLSRIIDRVRTAVLEFLAAVFEGIGVPENWAVGLGRGLTVVFIVLGVLLVAWILWRVVQGTGKGRREGLASGGSGPEGRLGPEEWHARAREAAGRGAYREAAFALYRSVILRLGEAGVIRVREGRTPGEYAREARGRQPALTSPFREFLGVFHPVAFGARTPDGAAFASLEAAAERVLGVVGARVDGGAG